MEQNDQQNPGFFDPLLSELAQTGAIRLRGVTAGARPWLAAALSRAGAAPLLWIVKDEATAEDACQAARFFLSDLKRDPGDAFAAQALLFPLHQNVPYEELSPDREAMADRLAVLFRLVQRSPPRLIVASVPSLMRLGIPRAAIDATSLLVLAGQELDRIQLAAQLIRAGYLQVPMVEDPGSFAIRGGIVDIYPSLLPLPVRIELLGDEVERIRVFDPQSQRTVQQVESVYLGPVREILFDEEHRARAAEALAQLGDALDLPGNRWLQTYRSVRDGVWFFGIESLLPAFHRQLESAFDFLGPEVTLLLEDVGAIEAAAREFWEHAQTDYQEAAKAANLVFPPERYLLSPDQLQVELQKRRRLTVGLAEEAGPAQEITCQEVTGLRRRIQGQAAAEDPLAPLVELLSSWRREHLRPFLVASRPSRARELLSMLKRRQIPVRLESDDFDLAWTDREPALHPPVRIVSGEIFGAFTCARARLAFLPDAEVFGRTVQRARSAAHAAKVASLKPGDLVVHADFGIGQFEGLRKLPVAGSEADYLLLHYRDGDRLYLPVTRMNLVERYVGPAGSDSAKPPLSKLGGLAWAKTKQKVQQELLEMADKIIRLEAARRAQPGEAVRPPGEEYAALEAAFPFEETDDQERAIREVIADITKPRAMDRLVCGDVGFGKTEVALRAAFLNAVSGRQTAVLVPTTVLAMQHLATFRGRLRDWPMRIEMLSRMVKPADQKAILKDLLDGKVDIVVGTHRLLLDDVRFHKLGLLVIDEEHRFGVRHKEKLKSLKHDVDVLTMTATPIPRTLQLSLTGIRDISVIHTPPAGRRSIRTVITRFTKRVIHEAISTELSRGGQVYFLHNWVKSLPAMERFIRKIVPQARTAIAHGQMGERGLETVMTDFVSRKIDVLICTSIIESGLDIPAANTIIINRADHFGLSQLHQIRGRVGRSAERAYAYLLIPGLEAITPDARKRLEVLSEHSDLGAGYQIASQDLEIRGSGNLLGKAQSGNIAQVGFELYTRLLERAVMEAKGLTATEGTEPEISLPIAGYLPEDYLPDIEQRLEIYSRLSRAASEDAVFDIEREISDRFGPEPPEVENLCELMALKTVLRRLGVNTLEFKGGNLTVKLDPKNCLDIDKLISYARQQPERIALLPEGGFLLKLAAEERAEILQHARTTLLGLA